ncbi:MAG: FGGY family carbohydrate kinase, partial [Pseudomonadota bacterium]
ELFAQIDTVLLPKDYLALWMTGEVGTDRSDAAGTLWLDQNARNWSSAVIAATGIDASMLPPLRDGFELAGNLRDTVAEQLGLAAGMPVFAGGGDAATGAIALGAAEAGKCFMSLGTSGQLLMVDDDYRPDPTRFIHDYCHTLPGLWYRMAAMLNGARPLAWFAGVLDVTVPEMLRLSEQADSNRIPLFLPYLTGERSPHGDPDIRGGFYGLDDATGRAEMARAVVEAVSFSMGDAKASFGAAFEPAGPIPAIGGGSRSDAVLQAIATVIDHPVARAEVGEGGAAMGAALLAELGAGLRDHASIAHDPALSKIFLSQSDPTLLDRFARFQALYEALKHTATVNGLTGKNLTP